MGKRRAGSQTGISLEYLWRRGRYEYYCIIVKHEALMEYERNIFLFLEKFCIATLALGLRPRQGLARVRAKREAWESHIMLLGV
jgi:hypothetical protein